MSQVSLFDTLNPYFFLAGLDLGGVHELLALLHVDEFEACWDEDAIVLTGIARIDSRDPDSLTFSPLASAGAPSQTSAATSGSVWEWHDLTVRFRLAAPRQAGNVIEPTGTLADLLATFGPSDGGDAVPSDYPGTRFKLELLLSLVTVGLGDDFRGAKLEPNGLLVEDSNQPRVKLTLPRVLLIVTQGVGPDAPFNISVGSWGASGLDGQSTDVASLVEMRPPYAIWKDKTFGFAFRSATLDLDDSTTPPELLQKFGIGEDWQGVYLPEARIFVAPSGLTGFAVNGGVRDLLVGVHNTPGLWGDFLLDVVNQGDALHVTLRFFDREHRELDAEVPRSAGGAYAVGVPEGAYMVVDVNGAAPHVIRSLPDRAPDSPSPARDAFDAAEDVSNRGRIPIENTRHQHALFVTSRNSQSALVLIEVSPRSPEAQPNAPRAGDGDLRFEPDAALPDGYAVAVSPAPGGAWLLASPAEGVRVTVEVDGAAPVQGARSQVSLAEGDANARVRITWAPSAEPTPARVHGFFAFGEPDEQAGDDLPRLAPGPAGGMVAGSEELRRFLEHAPADSSLRIDGYASYENIPARRDWNSALSMRRVEALERVVRAALDSGRGDGTPFAPTLYNIEKYPWGNDRHPLDAANNMPGDDPLRRQLASGYPDADQAATEAGGNVPSSVFWRATVSYTRTLSTSPVVVEGRVVRSSNAPSRTEHRDPSPPARRRPDFLRELGATVRIEQDQFIALELRGKVDFQTAAENGLEAIRNGEASPPALPPRANTEDGVVAFVLGISHDDTTGTWTERLKVAAGSDDRNGLVSFGSIPASASVEPRKDVGLDYLGLFFTLAPLLSSTARDTPDAGDVVPLAVELALIPLLSGLDVVRVEQVTLYGVEASLKHNGAFTDGKVSVLHDIETALWTKLALGSTTIVRCRSDKPIRVRYKAIGFTVNAGFDGTGPFVPVFDAGQGYTIDLADSGSLEVLPDFPGLGEILRIAGARIARTNPLHLELDLALGVDLGVFSVDKIGFRLPIDPLGTPTLTSLGISLDIPNVILGKGELSLRENGFSGAIDLSLPSLKLRIAGSLSVAGIEDKANHRKATSVFVALGAEFPVGIPLGGTGLGMFGVLGLFAMHQRRNEPTTGNNRALQWLKSVEGDPTKLSGWMPELDAWAFGAGIILGTMEGAYVVRMSGMVVIEVPGPRLLFFLKGDLLNTKPRGSTKKESGNFLVAIDVAPTHLSIGIQIDYQLKPILQLTIPVEAYFPFPGGQSSGETPLDFYLHCGSIASPITAMVFEVFRATAYLMIHGNGIDDFPLGPLQGFSIATGFHVSLTWGYKEINLYLCVAAGFDAGVGFAPFFIAGRVYLRGELHLFVIALEATAELMAKSNIEHTLIQGSVCGRIKLLFFDVEGCVSFSVGQDPTEPAPPPLVRSLTLQSRSPALVSGTGVFRPIDAVLCRCVWRDGHPTLEDPSGEERNDLRVPIDSIPVVQMEVPPIDAPFAIMGDVHGAPPPAVGGWRKRGERWLRYTLESVVLSAPDLVEPTTPGERPNTWRTPADPGNGDAPTIDLALLDWCPDATPKAFLAGPELDAAAESRWGDVCRNVAAPAPVMWTFQQTASGESPHGGWRLTGAAWPDAPGSSRSSAVDVELAVVETWRTGDALEALLEVVPAQVISGLVTCPRERPRLIDRSRLRQLGGLELRPEPNAPATGTGAKVRAGGRPAVLPGPERPLVGTSVDIGTVLSAAARLCTSRVLQASSELRPGGEQPRAPSLATGQTSRVTLEEAAAVYSLLRRGRSVIRIASRRMQSLRMLALVDRKMLLEGGYAARTYYEGSTNPTAVTLDYTHVASLEDAPESWRDVRGPWAHDVALGFNLLRTKMTSEGEIVLFTFHLSAPTDWVEFGLMNARASEYAGRLPPPLYFVAAIEGLSRTEQDRAASETRVRAANTVAMSTALAADSARRALLIPGRRYEVAVRYKAEIARKKESEQDVADADGFVVVAADVVNQTSWFQTDSEPPARLSPWLLCQFPGPDERYHFHDDPITLVFGTDDVTQLFAAYGCRLRGVVRDASFRPPRSSATERPTRRLLDADVLQKLSGVLFSPWEQTMRRMHREAPCGNFNPDSPRHERAVLPLHLEPSAEYVFDVETVDEQGVVRSATPQGGVIEPLHRARLATSRYGSVTAMAEAVAQAYIASRRVAGAEALDALDATVPDRVFDAALAAAGLGASLPAVQPRVTILWTDASPPRPYGILLETPEPLWRVRPEPQAVRDADGRVVTWDLASVVWLSVDELVPESPGEPLHGGTMKFVQRQTGERDTRAPTLEQLRLRHLMPTPQPAPAQRAQAAGALVTRLAHDASGCRTLAVLAQGARGRDVRLALVRHLHPLIDQEQTAEPVPVVRVLVDRAPWEEST